jgi:hypothetical protein
VGGAVSTSVTQSVIVNNGDRRISFVLACAKSVSRTLGQIDPAVP